MAPPAEAFARGLGQLRNGRLALMRLTVLLVSVLYLPPLTYARVWVGRVNPTVESACLGSWRWRSRQWRLSLTPGGRGANSSNYGRLRGTDRWARGLMCGCEDRDADTKATVPGYLARVSRILRVAWSPQAVLGGAGEAYSVETGSSV